MSSTVEKAHIADKHQVQAKEVVPFSLPGWHVPSRYSPYALPSNHRLNYVPLSSRYNPQSSLQYPTVPSNIDYSAYSHQNPSVDWTRASYVGSYSPYPDDEDTGPYSSHPPPYILPNTDPMTTANSYYVHAQNVRPHPGTLWPEPQQCMPQQSSHLPASAYTVTAEPPQPFYNAGLSGNLPSDRTLPTPISARSMAVPQTNPTDGFPVSSSTQRNSTFWSSDPATSAHTQAEMNTNPEHSHDTRRNTSYSIQDLASYNQMGMAEALPTTALLSPLPLSSTNQAHAPSTAAHDSQHQHQHHLRPSVRIVTSHDQSPTSTSESTSVTYDYTGSLAGRGPQQQQQQLRSASGGHLSNGSLYCRTQSMLARREPAPDDCSPDCSGGCTTDSARASVTSISNTSSGH